MRQLYFSKISLLVLFLFAFQIVFSQNNIYKNHWKIGNNNSIEWDLENDQNLPHKDNIELAGTQVAGIISYEIDTNKILKINRQIFFPQIHPYIKSTDPDWYIYRAYEKKIYSDEDVLPTIIVDGKNYVPSPVEKIKIDGMIHFFHKSNDQGIQVERVFFPSTDKRKFLEKWIFTNTSKKHLQLMFGGNNSSRKGFTKEGYYAVKVVQNIPGYYSISPNQTIDFSIEICARKENESFPNDHFERDFENRKELLNSWKNSLQLKTPNPTLNQLFEFSKIRAAESIFESKLGLIHSPGGGRYYVGIWANDQAEYVNPFFPYLGYDIGNESAMNTYRSFAKEINPEFKKIRYAFEIEGEVPPFLLDRGDAAMIAYGASQFALAKGDLNIAKELWPLIQWCLEYCHRQLNSEGVVLSESDEMEGRIETGVANLSTSSLYYGALGHASDLLQSMSLHNSDEKKYDTRRKELHQSIEKYFGATVEGLETYKYYKEHKYLRHWICLPLVVGIFERKEETIKALFEKLWSPNGVHVEKNSDNEAISKIFWDRGTLYALRGTFLAGATEISLEKLIQFSEERLLGKRVPYVVEAYPEGNMAHLSAESALYCRVFIEGVFGIVPTSLNGFKCTPRLPKNWDFMELDHIKAFGKNFKIRVFKKGDSTFIRIEESLTKKIFLEKKLEKNETVDFNFNFLNKY